ncbi:unnamed protein product [Brassica napus]|uniref:(rape) hypothetical protein n=1 Tax=Brassica napus TaxID=3708 RepID=A0A816NFL1_BRANA|nr:unnamed protein product [Brassica napus]
MGLSNSFQIFDGYYNKRPIKNIKVHNLFGIVVSVVMKYAENTVKTSVALLLTTVVSVYLFNFHVSLAFLLGSSKLTAFASVNTINLTFSHKIA